MRYYELIEGKSRSTEIGAVAFSQEFGLIVSGLGSAGTFCALAAAQEGLTVCGLERGSCCGGMSVQGVVNGYYNGYPGGLFEEVDSEANKAVGTVYRSFFNHPDAKKRVMEQKLISAGVGVHYHSVVIGIYAEERQITGVRVLTEGKIRDIGCRFLSDSTSNGYVLRLLGIAGSVGRPTDGRTQPFSSVRVFRRPDGKLGRTNHDSGYIDQYRPRSFSESVIEANASHAEVGLNDRRRERFLFLAPQIGIREGMVFEGEDRLTLEDVLYEKECARTLVCAYSDIDKHGDDYAFDSALYQEWRVANNLSTITFKIRVPMGAIVPKGWKGLASVSRCLSVGNYVSSAVRMNRDMYRLGEASGVAIAMAVKSGRGLRDIDYPAFLKAVRKRGCFDPRLAELRGFVGADGGFTPVAWLTDIREVRRQLSGDCPGVAFWSCRRLGLPAVRNDLVRMMSQVQDAELRLNAAVALGNLGDDICLPVLREIVCNRSEYHYLDCRRSNQMRSVIAIYLCGRFGDAEIVPELLEILKPQEYGRRMYHVYTKPSYQLSITENFNSVYYQHLSFAIVALATIARKHPAIQNRIAAALQEAVRTDDYIGRITADRRMNSPNYRIAANLRTYIGNFLGKEL